MIIVWPQVHQETKAQTLLEAQNKSNLILLQDWA